MRNSKIFTLILTFFVVILSCFVYEPGLSLINWLKLNELQIFVIFLPWFSAQQENISEDLNTLNSESLFSASELSHYNGIKNDKIYLSILGRVFDVTKGKQYYGVGENYHGFAGKDASRAFITGDFTEKGLKDDISDLTVKELGDLHEWVQKYEKDYTYKGKLIGRFYDSSGRPTKFLREFDDKLHLLSDIRKREDYYKKNYPPCNAEWTPESGSRVWCSRNSGGVKRDWIGFPRKFHQPGSGVSRCACINLKSKERKQGNFEVYENCDPYSVSCYLT